MPRKKTAVFVTVITALLVVMVLSVAMSVHHYEKTVLITLDAAGEQAAENETGLAEIRRQLEADKADASTGTMFWKWFCLCYKVSRLGAAGQQHIISSISIGTSFFQLLDTALHLYSLGSLIRKRSMKSSVS